MTTNLAARVAAYGLERWLSRLETNPPARLGRLLRRVQPDPSGPRRALPPPVMEALQNIRLRRTMARVARHSPFYRSRFAELGITPEAIRGIGDVARLPFTSSADIQHAEQFLCVPRDRIAYIFTTSGTSRQPKQAFRTRADFERIVNLPALAIRHQAWQERLVCMIAHAHGMFGLVDGAVAVAQRAGGLALPIGQPPPDEAMQALCRYRPNAIMTSPSYMAALTRRAEQARLRHPLRMIVLDGEILTPAQVEKFAGYWQAEVVNGYGLTEVGVVAFGPHGCDALHLNRPGILAEIVDPATGEPAEEGELVVTTLAQEAMPLLRYRTGDRVRWQPCRCGWVAPSIHVFGRFGDSIVVAATNLHGPLIAEDIAAIDGTTGSVEIVVDHVDGVDRLTLRVGVQPGAAVERETVAQQLFAIYPALADDRRAEAFELTVELLEGFRLSPKPLRVRDLR
jgi:phenylacetate-CoA ligase